MYMCRGWTFGSIKVTSRMDRHGECMGAWKRNDDRKDVRQVL